MSEIQALLVLPHLRVQNANAISSPMTWGFPAMSAFVGLMHALERKAADRGIALLFDSVGVICHEYEAQVTHGGFTRAFHLTRNPVDKAGNTAGIVEEGRAHLDITTTFAVRGDACRGDEKARDHLAQEIADFISGMRIAGGSVMPALPGQAARRHPRLEPLDERPEERAKQFKALRCQWLPGFALVCRDDLLTQHLSELRKGSPNATALDAWLDLSRINHICHTEPSERGDGKESQVKWEVRRPFPGWLVPIPVGYGALSELYAPGEVVNTRDQTTPFRFVESLYSIGQWLGPHRLERAEDMLWYVDNDLDAGIYRLNNAYSHRN